MDQQWIDLNILMDVGNRFHENTTQVISDQTQALKRRTADGAVNRRNEIGAKLLKCIFECSKHFSEGATTEYNALPANWQECMWPHTHWQDKETWMQ